MITGARRILVGLAASLTMAGCLIAGSATPAVAFGGETFGCRVAPGPAVNFTQVCSNKVPSRNYDIGFALQNLSGSGYTYSWSISGYGVTITGGCTSTSPTCSVRVSADEQLITARLTYSQGGQSATRVSMASIIAFCGPVYC